MFQSYLKRGIFKDSKNNNNNNMTKYLSQSDLLMGVDRFTALCLSPAPQRLYDTDSTNFSYCVLFCFVFSQPQLWVETQ